MREWWREIYSASYGEDTHLDEVSLGVRGREEEGQGWREHTSFSGKKVKCFMILSGQCRSGGSNRDV